MKLAMIGLGRMGSNMARRLMAGGHEIVGYDHDPAAFMQHLTSFVEQIDAVDYINLFLSGLKCVALLFFGLVHSNLTLHLVS